MDPCEKTDGARWLGTNMGMDRDPRKEVIGAGEVNTLSDKGLLAEPFPIVADTEAEDKLDDMAPCDSFSITRVRLLAEEPLDTGAISSARIMERRVSNDSYRFISLERPIETLVPLRTSNNDTSFGLDLNCEQGVRNNR